LINHLSFQIRLASRKGDSRINHLINFIFTKKNRTTPEDIFPSEEKKTMREKGIHVTPHNEIK